MKKYFFLALMCFLTACFPQKTIKQPDGMLAPESPVQKSLDEKKLFKKGKYSLKALASYEGTFRILSRKEYPYDDSKDLSTLDFALGWGKMSSNEVLDRLKIKQRGRWYLWSYSGTAPIPHKEILSHSANTHILPANSRIEKAVDKMYKGHVIYLKGYLVSCSSPDGFRWKSSVSRTDTGNGACEVMYVTEARLASASPSSSERSNPFE